MLSDWRILQTLNELTPELKPVAWSTNCKA
jgi:hypothetical protein